MGRALMLELPLASSVNTVLLSLLTPAVLATAKFLADVRKQLSGFRQLLLGYEDRGGGLLEQVGRVPKLEKDLDAAWARIRNLELLAGATPPAPLTSERGAA